MKEYYKANAGTVTFAAYSREKIEYIRLLAKRDKQLKAVLMVGVFANIFVNDKVLEVSYNVTSMDWNLYFDSVRSVSPTIAKRISNELEKAVIHYGAGDTFNKELRDFWEGMYDAFYDIK